VQREFEKILDEARDRGAAIILSSHVLSEVEHLADRIAIINQGAIVIVDEISTLKSKARRRIDLFFDKEISKNDFSKVPNIKEIEVEDGSLHCVVTGSEHELLKRAVELGVSEVRTQESSLEEIFLDLVGSK
jgi:ABC-2 type transport system ATP-binding protein